jgi:NRAMP (natural resistance-associated macrophage protein)-like metal ion transporter
VNRRASAKSRLRRALAILGPGLITGASDDDPSGIATYAMAGASLGFSTLWTALVTFPMMATIQFICAKIAMVSGRGLAGVLRRHYARPVLYLAVAGLVAANTINVGADLGGVADALSLLVPLRPIVMIVPVAAAILALQVWGSYRLIARIFKWLTLALLAYVGAAVLAKPDPLAVLAGTFVPTIRLDGQSLATLVALLGTTISPYLFFWQASQEVEEEHALGRRTVRQREGATRTELAHRLWDVTAGMALSNAVMYFIILAAAATLFRSGTTDIETAADAAQALRPLAGGAATVLFALGLIGSGLLAIPILSGSAAYALAEGFGWRSGLDERPWRAMRFYVVIAVSTTIGVAMNFLGWKAMSALFWTAVINGCLAPPLLVAVMLIANNRTIMKADTIGWRLNLVGWLTTAVMFAAAIGLAATWNSS